MKYYKEDGHLNEQGIAYVQQHASETSEYRQHLDQCEHCQTQQHLLHDFLDEFEGSNEKPKRSVYLRVASVLILLFSGFLFWQMNQHNSFTKNEHYEFLLGSATRAELIQISSPKLYEEYTTLPIRFSWETTGIESVSLVILNNIGEVTDRFETKNQSLDYNNPKLNGLYYWKLESVNEVLFVGSFEVKK